MGSTRRAVATGLTAGALLSPAFARANVSPIVAPQPQPPVSHQPSAGEASDPASKVAAATDESDRMTVPVWLNGLGPYPFVIDTGSNRTVISDVLARQLGLPMGPDVQVHAATGVVGATTVHITSLDVGHRKITDFDAPVLIRANLGALGMLGIDAVSNQRIVMDFRRQQMSFATVTRMHDDAGAVVVRARSKYGQLLLVDCTVERIPLYVIIDTGGETTIGNPKLRDMLARRRAAAGTPVTVTSVTGDVIKADLTFLPQVEIGKIVVNNLQIAYADMYTFKKFGLADKPAMLLGMSTLRHFDRVAINFPDREVRFLIGA